MGSRTSRNQMRLERQAEERRHEGTIQQQAAQRAPRRRRWMMDNQTGEILPGAAALIARALGRRSA